MSGPHRLDLLRVMARTNQAAAGREDIELLVGAERRAVALLLSEYATALTAARLPEDDATRGWLEGVRPDVEGTVARSNAGLAQAPGVAAALNEERQVVALHLWSFAAAVLAEQAKWANRFEAKVPQWWLDRGGDVSLADRDALFDAAFEWLEGER